MRPVPGTGSVEDRDAVLVGGGVMSATLGMLFAQAEPDRRVLVVERLDEAWCGSSAAEHNAGTGHAGLCGSHYTPRRPDGTVDASAAALIAEQFAASAQRPRCVAMGPPRLGATLSAVALRGGRAARSAVPR